MFVFEGLWLVIFILLNLTINSPDLSVLQTVSESEVLNLSPKPHISHSILSLLLILFLEQITVLRNLISFSSVAIIILSRRV